MGTNLNFKSFEDEPPAEGNGSGRPSGNFSFPLPRQTSIYSLTFDEFRSSLGKDFGSLNMDEFMKSIWTAEETQNMASTSSANGGCQIGGNQGNHLHRQGSLTLPRTLSQKTVDEVWRDMTKESNSGQEAGLPQTAQRQPTLAEITLEEFLLRAGVIREDQLAAKANPGGSLGDLVQPNNANDMCFGIGFQHSGQGLGLMGSNLSDISAQVQQQVISPQMQQQQQHQQQQQQKLQQPPLIAKQSAVSYSQTMAIPNSTQLRSLGIRGGVAGYENQTPNGNPGQGFGLQGGAMGVATAPPTNFPSDGIGRRNVDSPFGSSAPYTFNGGLRGRKTSNTVEKVIERRQKRMIKNRESAARSRARKQAYTTELEEEVAKLKEENEELRLKQEEIKEMHKNQILEMIKVPQHGAKKRCLRRTQTGLW